MSETVEMKVKKKGKRVQDCFWKQCMVCVTLLVAVFAFYTIMGNHITVEKDLEHLTEDDFSFVFQIDEVREEKKRLVLDGWAFKMGRDATKKDIEILLYDLDIGEIIYPTSVKFTSRTDVNDYFSCEYDYTDCGVVAFFSSSKLDIRNKNYEILISDKVSFRVNRTGTYLKDGKLMYCSPENYKKLQADGKELEQVVENGVLKVCRPDVGMYVYQYDDNLYWVADKTCEFVNKESTYIDCMVSTTQPNFLPESRKEFGYTNDNLDFFFQNNELIDVNMNGYRVAKIEIPSEYSVTSILTGHRVNDEWIWKDNFRIHYQFAEGDMKYE